MRGQVLGNAVLVREKTEYIRVGKYLKKSVYDVLSAAVK